MALTDKQLIFATKILEGETYEKAFAAAYPLSADKSRSYRDCHASRLLEGCKELRDYIDAEKAKMAEILTERARKKGLWTRERSVEAAVEMVEAALFDIRRAITRVSDSPKSRERVVATSTTTAITNGVRLLMELMGDEKAAENATLAEQLIKLSVDGLTEKPEDYEAPIPSTIKREK